MNSLGSKYSKHLYSSRDHTINPGYDPATSNSCPPSLILEENVADEKNPGFNSLNNERPRSSGLLDTSDSMAMHLLVETAIYDSNKFDVLSYEEVEKLKKEFTFLENRIDASKRKLALESKVRDAALSLSRLYSKKGRRRQSLHNSHENKDQNDVPTHTEKELISSNLKCEVLSEELCRLNNRVMDIQKRLLQHNAGILSMTHSKSGNPKPQLSSPDSSYIVVNGNSTQYGRGPQFDDRSYYRTPDKLRNFGETRNSLSVYEGHGKRDMNDEFIAVRLQELNIQFRELLLETSQSQQLPPPPHFPTNGIMHSTGIHEQFSLLDQNIQYIRQNPLLSNNDFSSNDAAEQLQRTEAISTTIWGMLLMGEDQIRNYHTSDTESDSSETNLQSDYQEYSITALSAKIQHFFNRFMTLGQERDMMKSQVTKHQHDMIGANERMRRLEDQLVQSEIDLNAKRDEMATVMHQLDAERKKDQRKTMEVNQNLQKESSALEVERQQRNEAEGRFIVRIREKEGNIANLQARFDEVREDRDLKKAELQAMKQATECKLAMFEEEIVRLKAARQLSEQARETSNRQEEIIKEQLAEKVKEIARMDEEIGELSGKVAELSTEVVMAKAELDASYGSKQQRAAATAEARAAAAALEAANKQPQSVDPTLLQEIEDLSQKNQELVNEIVILKNDRANAANSEHVEKRCRDLQLELDGMLKDFENLTKQSIENEQEHNKLENIIDSLKEKNEGLETALGEEKIKGLGSRQPSVADIRSPSARHLGESTSTNVLKQEFKKMMREMRADSAKSLRAEQEERRKLEGIIRNLKKDQLQSRRGTSTTSIG